MKDKKSDEFIDVAKEKLAGAYEVTSNFTSKAFHKVREV